jgi:hypothetical protein
VGWLLAIAADQVVGYEHWLVTDLNSATPSSAAATRVNRGGWEIVSRSGDREYDLRRHRWMGWVEYLRCPGGRWCF